MERFDELARMMEITRDFRYAMLVTVSDDGSFHGRPMTIADTDDQKGALYFLADKRGDAVSEVRTDARALVTMQDGDAYVQWVGRAHLVDDPQRVRELWTPRFTTWFPSGPDDPGVAIVRLDVEIGEYWDRKGGMKMRARLRTTPRSEASEPPPPRHGTVVPPPRA